METLSIVVITFNEEKNIGRCIRSLSAIGDEIIILDSFSTDRTVQIAEELGALVYQGNFKGYGTQKNAAAELASGNYIFFVDADELLSNKLLALIRREKEKGFPADGYSMNRLTNFCGQWIRHGSWYPDRKLRIINRKKGKWSNAIVHESIEMEKGSSIRHLRGDLLHYSYSSIEELVNKNNHYSTLSAKAQFASGKRTNRIKIFLNPSWAFFYNFFLRLGFLDGVNGFIIAINLFYFTFLKHMKLFLLQKSRVRITQKISPVHQVDTVSGNT